MNSDDQQWEDDIAAAYAQRENEERREWEERILARGRRVAEEFNREVKEWLEEHI